ncbi:MAG TPA: iron ABC transporter permease [Pseudolysinimonas sp.]|nr:iron ABC transporter permease [Pseudolysinimonas sp.]
MSAGLAVTIEVTDTSAHARQRHRSRRRAALVIAALLVVLLGGSALSLSLGTGLSLPRLASTLLGAGDAGDEFLLFRLQVPRILLAVVVGIAFGIAGALLQAVARNPLASPDLLGISGGASVGAVGTLLLLGASGPAVALGAFGGAAVAATAIALLAWNQGITGYRFVLIGIAIAFLANAVVNYLLTRAQVQQAQGALVWIVGSVAGANLADVLLVVASFAILLPLTVVLAPRLMLLQFGDDAARSWGVRADATRIGGLAVSVALAAVGTAVAGPVAFVAFVSAPIARRLVGGELSLATSGLTGAALVVVADLVGQHLLPGGLQVPVGIVTAAIGAPYLLGLLALSNRRGRGA